MPGKDDTELRSKGVFEEGGTPLYQFAKGLELRGPTTGELLQESGKIAERRAGRLEESAKTLKARAEETTALAKEQAATREKERPAPYEPPASPDLAARPFLSPPQSVLGQLQTALVGIGQLAQGIGGLKGKGYAIGATAALKGALEGWQAGDQERAQRAFEQWQVDTQRLLTAHRSRRERYQDILDDQTRTMQDRLSQIGLEARITEVGDLADAAREGHLDKVVDWIDKERTYALNVSKALTEATKWDALRAKDQRNFEALQAQRAQANKFRREQLDEQKKTRDALLRKTTLKELEPFQKAGKLADGLSELEKIYSTLERDHPELAPKSAEVFDAWAARVQRFLRPGDTSLFQMKLLWNQVIVGLLERGWSDEKGVRALAVFQSQINVQDQMPPPEALHTVMKSIRGMVRKGVERDMVARERLGASPEEMALANMYIQTLHDPAESELLDTMRDEFTR